MDRENIGGNMSGQQSNYISRGGNPTNNKWSLDGVDITDMSATGASPSYYDFDAFQEMTINTGGVDVTQQTGGVGINLVTKSGTDRFRGSSRYYAHRRVGSSRTTSATALRRQGATSGNPIQNIKDYGVEAGGPIRTRPRLGVGQLRQADDRRRRHRLLQAERRVPGVQAADGALARADRGSQRLPEHRPHAAAGDQPEGAKCSCSRATSCRCSTTSPRRSATRAARRDLNPIETTTPQKAVRQELRQVPVEHRAEPDLQVRQPVGGQRSSAARRAVRARRQQLHARPAVAGPAHGAADASSSRPA